MTQQPKSFGERIPTLVIFVLWLLAIMAGAYVTYLLFFNPSVPGA